MALRIPPSVTSALRSVPIWGWGVLAGLFVVGVTMGNAAAKQLPGKVPAVKKPAGSPPLVKLGDTGPWVKYLQSLLGVATSGTFDAATDAAARAYQAAHGLEVDGKVGTNTWKSLGVTATSAPPPKPGTGGGGGSLPPGGVLGGAGGVELSDNIATREGQILAAVAAGDIDHQWTPIQWSAPDGRVVRVLVSRRAFAITDGGTGRMIVNASMPTHQKIADMIGGSMLTTKMSDKIYELADIKLGVLSHPWDQDNSMAKTYRMVEQNALIESKVDDDGVSLVANEGKDWVLTRRWWNPPEGIGHEAPEGQCSPVGTSPSWCSRHNAANFGWYMASATSQSPGGAKVIQSIGLRHDKSHTDYSQLLRFVKRDSLTIDGAPTNLEEALADPELSALLQDEGGTLPGIQHPDFGGVA